MRCSFRVLSASYLQLARVGAGRCGFQGGADPQLAGEERHEHKRVGHLAGHKEHEARRLVDA